MKNTLVFKTLAVIIAATLFLATGLIVLSASAMDDEPISEESIVIESFDENPVIEPDENDSVENPDVDETVEDEKKYPHLGGGYAEDENQGFVIDIFDNLY